LQVEISGQTEHVGCHSLGKSQTNHGFVALSTQEPGPSAEGSMVPRATMFAAVPAVGVTPHQAIVPSRGGALVDLDQPCPPPRKSARFQGSTGLQITREADTMDEDDSDDDGSQDGDATWEEYDALLEDAATAVSPADFLGALADALDVADFLAVDDPSLLKLSDSLVMSVSRYFRKNRGAPPQPATNSAQRTSQLSLHH